MELKSARTAQWPLWAEFTFNFDDTMLDVNGVSKDFGKTNVAETAFDIIPCPQDAVVVAGELVTETAFDAATYAVKVGDATVTDRYLASADRKGAARVALVPTGFRSAGEKIRITVTPADVCTAGKMTVRIGYVIKDRGNEVQL